MTSETKSIMLSSPYKVSDLSFYLEITTSEPTQQIGSLYNTKESPTATIKSISSSTPLVWNGEDFHPLQANELEAVLIKKPSIEIINQVGKFTFKAPNGVCFTVQNTIDAIVEVESKVRGQMKWYGGVDTHHIDFEGSYDDEGILTVYWGS